MKGNMVMDSTPTPPKKKKKKNTGCCHLIAREDNHRTKLPSCSCLCLEKLFICFYFLFLNICSTIYDNLFHLIYHFKSPPPLNYM